MNINSVSYIFLFVIISKAISVEVILLSTSNSSETARSYHAGNIWISFESTAKLKIIKSCSDKDLSCKVSLTDKLKKNDFILSETTPLNKSKGKSFYAFHNDINQDLVGQIQIIKEAYFINLTSEEWYEEYYINGIKIRNLLGKVQQANDSMVLKFDSLLPTNVLDRRSDFHGKHFVAMTEELKPCIFFQEELRKEARYFRNNDTFDVTKYTQGTFHEFYQTVLRHHNATVSYYKRNDGIWGSLVNGSMNGMFSNLVQEKADMILASLTRTNNRNEYADFLPPIHHDYDSIFIKVPEDQNDWSWFVLLNPLSWDVWLAIIVQSVAFATVIVFVESKVSLL